MLSSHELFGFMSPALALEIVTYAHESDKELYRATLTAVAEARRVRPVFLERQPRSERHAAMIASLSRSNLDLIAGNVVRGWLLKKHKAMLIDFLDALQIPHKDGVVEELPASMDDAKLTPAIEVLLGKYPPEVVGVYLHAFNEMNEVEWVNLTKRLEADQRLQLKG